MVRTYHGLRLIIEILSGIILIALFFGIALAAAVTVGWAMALGMMIVFTLEFIARTRRNN